MSEGKTYDIRIKVGVDGEGKAKSALRGVDKYLKKTEDRAKKMGRLKVGVTARVKDHASSPLDRIKRKATTTYQQMKKLNWASLGNQIGGAFKSGARFALKYGALIGAAIGGIGIADTFNTYKDFSASMSKVKAVSQANVQEMKALEAEARRLGATTEWTASQAADAEVALSQMGFTPQQTVASLGDMLSLATAGGLELGNAAEIVGGTLNAFNYSADNASRVADVLAVAASSSGTNVELMGESFRYAAPLAAGMGMEIEETAAALAILGNMNIKGSQAGTTMVAMLNDLTSTSAKAQSAMKSIGFTAYDAQGKMKDFPTMMSELSHSLEGMTDEAKTNVLKDIFGTRATRGVLSFLSQGSEEIDKMTAAMHNADGAAKTMAETMQDNLQGDVKKLRSAIEAEQLSMGDRAGAPMRKMIQSLTAQIPNIGKALEPFISKAADFIANLDMEDVVNRGINGLKTLFQMLRGGLQAAKTIFTPIIGVVSFILKIFNKLPEPIQKMVGFVGAFMYLGRGVAGMFGGWGQILGTIGGKVVGIVKGFQGLSSLSGIGTALLNPMLAGVLGIAAGVYVIWKNWDKVSEWITKASEKALEFFGLTDEERRKNPSQYYYDREWDYVKGEKKEIPEPEAETAPAAQAVAEPAEAIAPSITEGLDDVPADIQKMIDDANMSLNMGMGEMVTTTEAKTGEMVSTITATREDFVVAGTDVVLGLVEGINGAAEQAIAAVANVAQQMSETARANLQIHSPSKVFEYFGEMLPEGLVVGIENLRGKAVGAMEKLMSVATPNFGGIEQAPFPVPALGVAAAGAQPTGGGGSNVTVYTTVNVAQDDDSIREIVDEAQEEFGRALYDALSNRQK